MYEKFWICAKKSAKCNLQKIANIPATTWRYLVSSLVIFFTANWDSACVNQILAPSAQKCGRSSLRVTDIFSKGTFFGVTTLDFREKQLVYDIVYVVYDINPRVDLLELKDGD